MRPLEERLGGHGWRILWLSVAVSLVSGVVYAVISDPGDLPTIIPTLGFLASIALGVPGLVSGLRSLIKGERNVAGPRILMFVGPLVVFVGIELVPHLLNPCLLADANGPEDSSFCKTVVHRAGFGGRGALVEDVDVNDRFHLLHHSVVGAIPMTLLYRQALRRWHAAVLGNPPHRNPDVS